MHNSRNIKSNISKQKKAHKLCKKMISDKRMNKYMREKMGILNKRADFFKKESNTNYRNDVFIKNENMLLKYDLKRWVKPSTR